MKKKSTIKIGSIIQKIRKSNGYTQEKLAEEEGCLKNNWDSETETMEASKSRRIAESDHGI